MKIYLDVCCLNRPFDDHSQIRIRVEAEAVLSILNRCQEKLDTLVTSDAVLFEISQTPDVERREWVQPLLDVECQHVSLTDAMAARARYLTGVGLSQLDALHVACAEQSAHVFLTTDDALLRKATAIPGITVRVENPVYWLMEVLDAGH